MMASDSSTTASKTRKFSLFDILLAVFFLSALPTPTIAGCGLPLGSESLNITQLGRFSQMPLVKARNSGKAYSANKQELMQDISKQNRNFSGFKCLPVADVVRRGGGSYDPNDEVDVFITNINFITGDYSCDYVFPDRKAVLRYASINESCQKELRPLHDFIADASVDAPPHLREYKIDGLGILNISGKDAFVSVESGVGASEVELFGSARSYFNVGKEHDEVKKNLLEAIAKHRKSMGDGNALAVVNQTDISSLDSHDRAEKTIPAYIVGLLTADSNFFSASKAGNSPVVMPTGAANIKDIVLTASAKVKDLADPDSVSVMTDSLDKQFWGYYLYFLSNSTKAFEEIIQLLFMVGVVGLFGYAGARKMAAGSDDDFRFNFTNKLVGSIMAFTFFAAPIVPESHTMPAQFTYKLTQASEKTSEVKAFSTGVQSTVRYMLQLGTKFANLYSDHAMFAYLKYINVSYGNYESDSIVNEFSSGVRDFTIDAIALEKSIAFFEAHCVPVYYEHLQKNKSMPTYINTVMQKPSDEKVLAPFGANRAEYGLCKSIYDKIEQQSHDSFSSARSLFVEFKDVEKTLSSRTKSDMAGLDRFNKTMVNFQNYFGWMAVVAVPSTYEITRLKEITNRLSKGERASKIEDTVVNISEQEVAQSSMYGSMPSVVGSDSARLAELEKEKSSSFWGKVKRLFSPTGAMLSGAVDSVKGMLSSIAGGVMSGLDKVIVFVIQTLGMFSFYFILPGFTDIFNMLNNADIGGYIYKVPFLSQLFIAELFSSHFNNGYLTLGATIGTSALEVVDKFGSILKIFKVASSFGFGSSTEAGVSQIGSVIVFLVTLSLAIFLYTIVLKTLSLVLVSFLIIIKIFYYFVEVIIAFVISPAIMMWSLTVERGNVGATMGEYFYKVSILALSPLLVVTSVYVYIFSKEIVTWLYYVLVEIVMRVSTDARELSGNYALLDIISRIFDYVTTIAYMVAFKSVGEVVLIFVNVYLAFNILFNFSDWVLSYFGDKAGGSQITKNSQEIFAEVKNRSVQSMV